MQKDPKYDPIKFQKELILVLSSNPEVIKMYNKPHINVGESIANLAEEIANQYELNSNMYL